MAKTQTLKKSNATKASQFKALAKGTELTLPSGFTVVARRVDMRTLLKTGRIPNMLRPVLDRAMQGTELNTEEFAQEVLSDPEKLDDIFAFCDQVFVDSVMDPKVGPAPDDPDERRDDIVYPDEVSTDDKFFIMNWAMGGSSDLERFREEQGAHVERVRSVAGDGSKSE